MPSAEMNKRMTAVLYTKGNEVCADCPARRPLWASLLVNPVEDDRKIGVLCCAECAQHHHFELGEKRTMIKYLKMVHEWILDDIAILEDSGNIFVNGFLEANLTDDDFTKDVVTDDKEKEDKRRGKFIKNKYKKKKFFDEVVYHKQVLEVLQKKHEQRRQEATDARRNSRRSHSGNSVGDDVSTTPMSESSRHSVESDNRRSAGNKLKESRAKMRGNRSFSSFASMDTSKGNSSLRSFQSSDGDSKHKSRRGKMGRASSMKNLSGMTIGRDKDFSVPHRTSSSGGRRSSQERSSHSKSGHGKRDSMGESSVGSTSSKQFKPNPWASTSSTGEGKGEETFPRKFKQNPYAA